MITTYIIPKGVLNATLQRIDESEIAGLLGMFTTGLSASGNLPITHYVSSGALSEEQIQWLDDNLPPAFTKDTERSGAEAIADKGLKIVSTGELP